MPPRPLPLLRNATCRLCLLPLVLWCGCHRIFPFDGATVSDAGRDADTLDTVAWAKPDALPTDLPSSDAAADAASPDTTAPDISLSDVTKKDSGLCPCTSCQDPQVVFVTSAPTNGAMGGLAGADLLCNDLASTALLPGLFVAWLSDSLTDARDRVSGGPWYTVDNDLVACDPADLTSGTLHHPINVTETHGAPSTVLVWTGTEDDGTADNFAGHTLCSDWTTGVFTVGDALMGWSDAADTTFTKAQSGGCHLVAPIYCFQIAP